MKIISFSEARSKGYKRYYTGIPCPNGHAVERLVSNKACCQCHNLRVIARYKVKYTERKEIENARSRRYRLRNIESERARAVKYYSNNKLAHRVRTIAHNQKIKLSPIPQILIDALPKALCPYCGVYPEQWHLDHKTPLCRDGTNTIDNVHWVCAPCNISKGRKTDIEFRVYLDRKVA